MLRYLSIAVFAIAAMLVVGCGNLNRKPRYDIGEPLEIEQFKRRAQHTGRDYIYKWKHEQFSPVTRPITRRLSPSQEDIIARHGQPDYIRKGFKSTTGEIVDEWAWWDREIIAQFVQRELVYEDALADMDKYLIRYGAPRRAWSQQVLTGAQRDMWDYQGFLLDTKGRIVTFTDGKLVSVSEY